MAKPKNELPRSDQSKGYVLLENGEVVKDGFDTSLAAQNYGMKLVSDGDANPDDLIVCELVPVAFGCGRIVWFDADNKEV